MISHGDGSEGIYESNNCSDVASEGEEVNLDTVRVKIGPQIDNRSQFDKMRMKKDSQMLKFSVDPLKGDMAQADDMNMRHNSRKR